MSKPIIILADSDDKYLISLEMKFIEELYEKIELEVITDKQYFDEYFATSKKAGVLVVSEEWYSPELQKHNISQIFVLSETMKASQVSNNATNRIYKYTSIKEIFNEIMYASSEQILSEAVISKQTQVVMLYSPIGGAGKTTVALGLSACLTSNYKKVIYIDAEYIHNFQNYLSSQSFVTNEFYQELTNLNGQVYQSIKPHLRTEMFDYLPPFRASLPALNLDFSVYKKLINAIKATKEYDFIVVDTDIVFDRSKAESLAIADKVIMVVNQDSYSVFKTNMLLNNIDCSDSEKYVFVCNKFVDKAVNGFLTEQEKSKVVISEYVEYIDNCEAYSIEKLTEIDGLQKVAYMLL